VRPVTLFFCGDVMTGRAIDQVLPHPGDPALHEPYATTAEEYVRLAEAASGPVTRPVGFDYVWGDALPLLAEIAPDVRIINLETSITNSLDYWPGKAVHYKMSPANIPCFTAAGIDCCCLANNHVMDWGYPGLAETLDTLAKAKIKSCGAGLDLEQAQRPAIMAAGEGRVIVFSLGSTTSGILPAWAAGENRPGVDLLPDLSEATAAEIGKRVQEIKRPGDIVVAAIHWGPNWGYQVPRQQAGFAHSLVDSAGVDIVYGHSSHHVKGIEVYRDRLVLYGCGDFLDDYEGIGGYEAYRGDLGLMYFPTVDAASGRLLGLRLAPTQVRRFRVNRAPPGDAAWLENTLDREGAALGTGVTMTADGCFELHWRRDR
jgi:poly-gamma-glutamate capsule biosynthesis protein CapA/YwtB (metallophosphatase superfamily)